VGYTAFRHAKFRRNYLELLQAHSRGTFLEIGPGMGELLQFVSAEARYPRLQAVDYAPDCVAHCRQLGIHQPVAQLDTASVWNRFNVGNGR